MLVENCAGWVSEATIQLSKMRPPKCIRRTLRDLDYRMLRKITTTAWRERSRGIGAIRPLEWRWLGDNRKLFRLLKA